MTITAGSYGKPLPLITAENQEFWDGCKQGVLKVPHCPACGRLFFPATPLCPYCFHEPVDWNTVSGIGKVYSFTIVRRATSPAFQKDVPYVVADIELTEGVRIPSNVIGCKPEDVRIDMAVRVVFEKVTDEISLPKFSPG